MQKNHTITLTKEIGKLWIIEDINPFDIKATNPLGMKFSRFYEEELFHDISKLTFIGAANYVLDIISVEDKRMDIELCISTEKLNLPGCVEFVRVDIGGLTAKYLVNNCPGTPQLETWISHACKEIFGEYPAFAYIKKK